MNPIINYAIEMVMNSLILGSFYFLFLKNLTVFRFNRFYLLGTMVLPFVLPLFQIPVAATSTLPNISVLLEEVTVGSESNIIAETSSFSWLQWLYFSVSAIIMTRIVLGVLSIVSVLRNANKHFVNENLLYVSPQQVNPFSVFRRIVVNEETFQDKDTLERIMIHEKAHVQQQHGIDLFVAEIICTVSWFNPMVWILKKELKSTHEYLADEKVLEQDFDLSEYFMLIFDNIVGKNVGLANNFNQSLNLKRMKMMKKKRSSRFARVASVMAVPFVLGATIMLTSQCTGSVEKEVELAKEVVKAEIVSTGISSNEKDEVVLKKSESDEKVFMIVDKMPSFPGGNEELMKFLRANVKFPAEAQENGIQGRVYTEFIVDRDGAITDIKILNGVDPLLDAEALRVVALMPNWEPGMQKSKTVRVSYRLPLNFTLR